MGPTPPCKAEICKSFAYDMQTYIDGSTYNEMSKFTFDDEKRGHEYYCQANRDGEEQGPKIEKAPAARKTAGAKLFSMAYFRRGYLLAFPLLWQV